MSRWLSRLLLFLVVAEILQPVESEDCSSEGGLRLVGGSTWREGRVEICLNSVWGTVCDDYWGSLDAQVTCRQLGYPVTGAVPLRSAHFGPGTGPIHIGSASCDGSEQRIVDCQLRYENGCIHNEDAGVTCPSPCSPHGGVRLTGSTPGRGTVEICLNGTWGTVCDNYWNIPDAEVVCRQLGYEGHDAQAYLSAYFGEGYGPVLLDYVNCNGDEASLLNCEYVNTTECDHSSDAGVDCLVASGNLATTTISHSLQYNMYISSMLIAWSSSVLYNKSSLTMLSLKLTSSSSSTTTTTLHSHQSMYISSMLTTMSSSLLYSKSSSAMLSLKHTSTVFILTQTSSASLISQPNPTSTANAGSNTQLHTFAVSSRASFNSLQSISTEDIKSFSSSELLTALTQTISFQPLYNTPASTIATESTSTPLSLTAMPTLRQPVYTQFSITSPSSTISDVGLISPLSLTAMPTLTQTEYMQFSFTSPSSTISDVGLTSPLSLTATPILTQTMSTWLLFTSPSSTSAAGWKQDNHSVAVGVSVTVIILCIAAVVVAMMIAFAVYKYRKKHPIFTMSIAEDPQLEDIYTRYKDTCRLIDDKLQEEQVSNPLVDDDDDDDVDHEQIELRPIEVVENEPAGDLHACKTQTSSTDLEPAKPTDSVINSEIHVHTREDTTALRSWDSDMEHDAEGEEIELIQKPQSIVGSSPHASAASMLSDSTHGGTQPQGDGQQQGSGGDHEETELRDNNDDP